MFKTRGGGGSKAVYTMLKTDDLQTIWSWVLSSNHKVLKINLIIKS